MIPASSLVALPRALGTTGLAGLALLAAAMLFDASTLKPLAARSEALDGDLARQLEGARATDARHARDAAPATKLAAFYRFVDTGHGPTGWLNELGALARGAGVQLRAAEYRLQALPGTRLERYEMTLPLEGGYAQIRTFLETALERIPVLSLDQVSFRRRNPGEAQVQAEARLTLHLVTEAPR